MLISYCNAFPLAMDNVGFRQYSQLLFEFKKRNLLFARVR